jgi:hypothetical protein
VPDLVELLNVTDGLLHVVVLRLASWGSEGVSLLSWHFVVQSRVLEGLGGSEVGWLELGHGLSLSLEDSTGSQERTIDLLHFDEFWVSKVKLNSDKLFWIVKR